MTIRNKTTKLISSLLIISIMLPGVLFSLPRKAEAQLTVVDVPNTVVNTLSSTFNGTTSASTTVNTGATLKTFAKTIGEELLKIAAKRLLAQMTLAVVNWINSGFHGAPLFIENPESFFRDIAKAQVRSLVDMIGYDTFRFPFGPQTALNVIESYKSQFAINAQYSLSKVINDPDLLIRYRNDFDYGGWNGFLVNTQYPQNNYLGFNMIVQQNLASRLEGTLQAPAQKVQNLLQQGLGFLSPQTCPSNPAYNNGVNEFQKPSYQSLSPRSIPDPNYDYSTDPATVTNMAEIEQATAQWRQDDAASRANWEQTNTCPGGLVSTTPGSVAANQIFNALDTPRESTTLAGALGNSVADSVGAIFDALLNHFMDQGLTALASTIRPAPPEDNWSYSGQTLTGNAPVVPGALNIPENVSVLVGEGTSTNISGGTAPFNIIPQTAAGRAVATATISTASSSGPKLTVLGIAPGTTAVTVFDSSTPSKTVVVNITTNAVGALVATPPNATVNINNPAVFAISGGEGNYSIQTSPDEQIAVAILSGTNLIVTGVSQGNTFIEVKDSSPVPKIVRANISIIDPTLLTVSQQNVFARNGRTTSIAISGGRKPYVFVGTLNPNVATGVISGDTLIITGQGLGNTSVIFRDSSLSPKTMTINVTTGTPLEVNPQEITLNSPNNFNRNNSSTARISGGDSPYSIVQTAESAAIATATISGSRLTIRAVSRGATTVIVKDSSTENPQTFTVDITVN